MRLTRAPQQTPLADAALAVRAFTASIELVDSALAGHCAAVALYSRDLAAMLGVSPADQTLVYVAGLLHDLGKLALPPRLRWTPAADLTLEERREFEAHPALAERALASADSVAVADLVRHQAEQFDGSGYPDGLAGEDIPLASRIIAVANAYNEMTMNTPLSNGIPERIARLRLARAAGVALDPNVVATFERLVSPLATTQSHA